MNIGTTEIIGITTVTVAVIAIIVQYMTSGPTRATTQIQAGSENIQIGDGATFNQAPLGW